MSKLKLFLFFLFFLALAADCVLIFKNMDEYRAYTKTLLVPILLIAIFLESANTRHRNSKILINLAFFFCFLGDFFLLGDQDATNFMMGLGSFLMAHLLFIFFFYRLKPFTPRYRLFIFTAFFSILAYIIFLLSLVWINAGRQGLQIPVTVYALALGFMFLCAVFTVNNRSIKRLAQNYFIPGALFFVLSDSMLAINKFFAPFTYAGIAVMITYASAMFLLANGIIRYLKK